jgi:hypothetical protein
LPWYTFVYSGFTQSITKERHPAERPREKINLNPAIVFAQDAKAFGETACPQFLSITRKVTGHRRTHRTVIPANAGIHAKKKHRHRICLPWVSACAETALRVDSRWISACRLASTAGFRINGSRQEGATASVLPKARLGEITTSRNCMRKRMRMREGEDEHPNAFF